MRPWLLLRHFKLGFKEIRIPLFVEGYQDRLRQYSPTLKVPVLIDEGQTIWDSLAICEYVSENIWMLRRYQRTSLYVRFVGLTVWKCIPASMQFDPRCQ